MKIRLGNRRRLKETIKYPRVTPIVTPKEADAIIVNIPTTKEVENKENKNTEDMTKAEEIAALAATMTDSKKSTKKNVIKKNDGLMERIDVTLVTEDNKIMLND